jgi:hypothetical protein
MSFLGNQFLTFMRREVTMPDRDDNMMDQYCPHCGAYTGGDSVCPNCSANLFDDSGLSEHDEGEGDTDDSEEPEQ